MLTNRGPDESSVIYKQGILYHGTVLWQQGSQPCRQPVESNNTVILFNGDLYMENIGTGSDTVFLCKVLSEAKTEDDLLNVFKMIIGPFSVICYFQSNLYFARDAMGRNSLLLGKHRDLIFLSSVVDPIGAEIEAIELPPLGVFKIDIHSRQLSLFPYRDINDHEHNINQLKLVDSIMPVEVLHQIKPEWLSSSLTQIPKYSFSEVCKDVNEEKVFETLLNIPEIHETCEIFINLLTSSIKDRVEKTPKLCKNCIKLKDIQCNHCSVGILFSGGVDCTLVATIAEKFIDPNLPIDLMNVAFEKVSYSKVKTDSVNWNVPDRLTGLQTLQELRTLHPERTWNFVEINITRAELNENSIKLSKLVYPLENVLDESLGGALSFASRGQGLVDGAQYSSPCRVILIGSGADELFGGYSRHRNAFKRSTSERDLLLEELNLDWIRLPSRNLARDDRVIADNGITVRAPFIEEHFVNFVQQLQPLQRCFPLFSENVGEKLLLRLCAFKLGLENACKFKKRALQFGSRIADKRQSAKDKSSFLEKFQV